MAVNALTVRNWTPEDVRALTPSVDMSPFGPLEGVRDVLQGSHLFEYRNGAQSALLALRLEQLEAGRRLNVVGLVSHQERIHAGILAAELDRVALALDMDQIVFCTMHRHIERAALAAGYRRTGSVLSKGLRCVQ